MIKAIVYERKPVKYGVSKAISMAGLESLSFQFGPLRLTELDPPQAPNISFKKFRPLLSGICGSDLATISAKSSRILEDVVSFPFVLGHETVGICDDGKLAVLKAVLSCEPRGLSLCQYCKEGRVDKCQNLKYGCLSPGLQTGFCKDTLGGWSEQLLAHDSQLMILPDTYSLKKAVLIEPLSCALHAALLAKVEKNSLIAVVGAGTMGLLSVAALRYFYPSTEIIVGAKYKHQEQLALLFGATQVAKPSALANLIRLKTKSLKVMGALSYGADIVIDAIGTAESLQFSFSITRPTADVICLGMPSKETIDLTLLWQRQLNLSGAYAYGYEEKHQKDTFSLASEIAASINVERLVSKIYPLENFVFAINHAFDAGKRGAVKIAFAPNTSLYNELKKKQEKTN
jgi:threonine dehydrogenase-like Zn-dependent dehydrogenase